MLFSLHVFQAFELGQIFQPLRSVVVIILVNCQLGNLELFLWRDGRVGNVLTQSAFHQIPGSDSLCVLDGKEVIGHGSAVFMRGKIVFDVFETSYYFRYLP